MNVGCECASDMNHVGVKVKSGGKVVKFTIIAMQIYNCLDCPIDN